MRLRCVGIFNNHFITLLLLNLIVKVFWKSVNIWQSCGVLFLFYFYSRGKFAKLKVNCCSCGIFREIKGEHSTDNGSDVSKVVRFTGSNGTDGQLGKRGYIYNRGIVWAATGSSIRCNSSGVDVWAWHWFTATRPAYEWHYLHDRPSMCCCWHTGENDQCR